MEPSRLTADLLAVTPDLRALVELAATALAVDVGDAGVVRIVGDDGEHLDAPAVHHRDPRAAEALAACVAGTGARADEGLSGMVRSSHRPFLRQQLSDLESLALAVPMQRPYVEEVGVSALLIIPLHVDGEYLGYVVCLRDRGSPPFTPADVALAEDLAARAALAVAQARGSRIRRQRALEQEAQLQLAQAAVAATSTETLFDTAARCLARALGGDWVQVMELVDEDLVMRAGGGPVAAPVTRVSLAESAYARAVLSSDEPVVLYDAGRAGAPAPSAATRAAGLHSGMAVALRASHRPLGAIAVHQRTPRRFSPEERWFLQAAATTVAGGLERRRADADLAHSSHHDPLTGLANRVLVVDRLEHAVARGRRSGGATAVVFIDLDRFAGFNNRFGHGFGDEVLRAFGRRLQEQLRPEDTACRLGGDEFVLVCEGLREAADAVTVADRLRRGLERPVVVRGVDVRLSASIGVAVAGPGEDAERLIRDADAAMYRAKTLGGNRVELFDENLRAEVLERIELRRALALSLEAGEIAVVHQPVLDLRRGRVVGTEALARWQHPERGAIPPATFVPAAEGTPLIDRLGALVLRLACTHAATGLLGVPGGRVSVNVSADQLQRGAAFVDLVQDVLASTRLPAHRLCLEITEAVAVSSAAQDVMQSVRDLGVTWSLDDFGTSYATLAAALDLPVAQIKLDRALVNRLASREQREVLAAIVALGSACGYECVAEGVERPEQLELVRAAACTHAQGYLVSRPLPVEELARGNAVHDLRLRG